MKQGPSGFWFGVLWGLAFVVVLLAMAFFLVTQVRAQTPPVSTIQALPDTTWSQDFDLHFTVQSTITPGGVEFYYRIPGETNWIYLGFTHTSPFPFHAPSVNKFYEFGSQCTDIEGNEELWPVDRPAGEQAEAWTYVVVGTPPNCPDPTVLEAVAVLAQNGFNSWGVPSLPRVLWYWTHPTTGTAVETYRAEWMVVPVGTCDTTISVFEGIAPGDTTFAQLELPYTYGASQTLRVQGVDAEGRIGPFSLWGDPFVDSGMPGEPGTPASTLTIVDPNEP